MMANRYVLILAASTTAMISIAGLVLAQHELRAVERDQTLRRHGSREQELSVDLDRHPGARENHGRNSSAEFLIIETASILMKLVAPGEFLMGSPEADNPTFRHERPQHRVRITRPFYLGVREVTQQQYRDVAGENPSRFLYTDNRNSGTPVVLTDAFPVDSVSWFDAVRFCNSLSELEGQEPFYRIDGESVRVPDWDATGFRLPTEAEWEFACRANVPPDTWGVGDSTGALREYAWFREPLEQRTTHLTGQKRPNAFGFYDMRGNISEWCWDWNASFYGRSPLEDPRGPTSGAGLSCRVHRGGNWDSDAATCRPECRHGASPGLACSFIGFRVARGGPKKSDEQFGPSREKRDQVRK
jgi:formylglycine-generating enzyme required for sulfatase activity